MAPLAVGFPREHPDRIDRPAAATRRLDSAHVSLRSGVSECVSLPLAGIHPPVSSRARVGEPRSFPSHSPVSFLQWNARLLPPLKSRWRETGLFLHFNSSEFQ